jgi:hypothetical protein
MYLVVTPQQGKNKIFFVSSTSDLEEETNLLFIRTLRQASIDEKYIVVEVRVT